MLLRQLLLLHPHQLAARLCCISRRVRQVVQRTRMRQRQHSRRVLQELLRVPMLLVVLRHLGWEQCSS
jgi:hypothetical protein